MKFQEAATACCTKVCWLDEVKHYKVYMAREGKTFADLDGCRECIDMKIHPMIASIGWMNCFLGQCAIRAQRPFVMEKNEG